MQSDFDRSLEQQFDNHPTNKAGYGANNQFAATDRNEVDPGRGPITNEAMTGGSDLTSDRVYRPA